MINMNKNLAYVDGSYLNSTGKVGAAFILFDSTGKQFIGQYTLDNSTNMRNVAGEIVAAQKVVEKALKLHMEELTIYYDYMGIEKWAKKEWKRNKKWTIDYCEKMQEYMKKIKLSFVKVEAHTGVELNEKVDELAKLALSRDIDTYL